MSDWRPIETAPMDGTEILLAVGQRAIEIGHWIPGIPSEWDRRIMRWNLGREGHWSTWNGEPTHWMPLPVSPHV